MELMASVILSISSSISDQIARILPDNPGSKTGSGQMAGNSDIRRPSLTNCGVAYPRMRGLIQR